MTAPILRSGLNWWIGAGGGIMLKPMFSGVNASAGVAGERMALALGYDLAEEFWGGLESRANLNSVQSTLGVGSGVRFTFPGRTDS